MFMQVNNFIKQKLYTDILNLISSNESVIDAYSGAGLLSAIVSKKAKNVVSIEIDENAVLSAKKLMEQNNIKNVNCIRANCSDALLKVAKGGTFNTVILDPARQGVDKKVIDAIEVSNIKRVIYVSCNPATLVRDLKLLSKVYDISLIQPYDMFPQTSDVETMVVLYRKELGE